MSYTTSQEEMVQHLCEQVQRSIPEVKRDIFPDYLPYTWLIPKLHNLCSYIYKQEPWENLQIQLAKVEEYRKDISLIPTDALKHYAEDKINSPETISKCCAFVCGYPTFLPGLYSPRYPQLIHARTDQFRRAEYQKAIQLGDTTVYISHGNVTGEVEGQRFRAPNLYLYGYGLENGNEVPATPIWWLVASNREAIIRRMVEEKILPAGTYLQAIIADQQETLIKTVNTLGWTLTPQCEDREFVNPNTQNQIKLFTVEVK